MVRACLPFLNLSSIFPLPATVRIAGGTQIAKLLCLCLPGTPLARLSLNFTTKKSKIPLHHVPARNNYISHAKVYSRAQRFTFLHSSCPCPSSGWCPPDF